MKKMDTSWLALCLVLGAFQAFGNTPVPPKSGANPAAGTTYLSAFANPQQFTTSIKDIVAPSCAYASPGYDKNGSFIITVTDGSGCAGTFRVEAHPIAGSGPDGSTPPVTTIDTYIGFPEGDFLFNKAGPGQYQVTVTQTGNVCKPAKNPITFTVTVPDGAMGGACDIPNPQQYTVATESIVAPSCAYDSPGYDNNGSFTITVADGSGCAGTFRVEAHPIAGSGPDGSTPPGTTIDTYIGFPKGSFIFSRAGPGQYQVTVTQTGFTCNPPKNPITFVVTVPDGATGGDCDIPNPQQYTVATESIVAPSCAYDSPGYDKNGSFVIKVTDGTGCSGTFRVEAHPIAGSGPSGSTPPGTTTDTYIGFPDGNFLFNRAGPGDYQVTVTQTGNVCHPAKNPITFTITVPDGATGGDCDTPNPQQFTVMTESIVTPSCAYDSPGYDKNGSFVIKVTDGTGCSGTFRVEAHPIAGSGPDGSTPPGTTTDTYIGFPDGNFLFNKAGPGQYQVTVTQTGNVCKPAKNPITFTVNVPDGTTGGDCDAPNPKQFAATIEEVVGTGCAYESADYDNNGSFTITVTDGSGCAGTYRVEAHPIAGSGPQGSTPPGTTIDTYIGFPDGDFLFNRAGPGQYQVTVTETGFACDPPKNPLTFTVTVPDGPFVSFEVGANQTVCTNKIPQPLTSSVSGVSDNTTFSYQWESSTTDCVKDFVPIPNATGTTYTFTSPLTQTTYFHLRITATRDGISCDAVSDCITITVLNVDCGAFPWNGN